MTERNGDRILLGVLIETVDGAIDLVDFGAGLTGGRARLLCLCSGRGRYLVCVICGGLGWPVPR